MSELEQLRQQSSYEHGQRIRIEAERNQLRSQLAAERERLMADGISERNWSNHLRVQLAAEVEKVNKLQEQLVAERERSTVTDIPAYASGTSIPSNTITKHPMEACRNPLNENKELIRELEQLREQLAAERERVQELQDELGVARETYQSARRSSDMGWQRAEDYKQQLAAEREKYERSQEKVKEYFDLLAAERETRQNDETICKRLDAEIQQLRSQLAAEREAAQALCKVYFDIAAEMIGEDEVRRRRDIALEKIGAKP